MKRIVLCRLGGIGDVIHTLPLVKYLRNKYKEASIEYITSENISELLTKCCPYIDRVWVYKKGFRIQDSVNYFFNLHTSLKFFFFNLFHIRAKKYFQYKKDNNFHAVVNFAKTYDKELSALHLDMKTIFVNNSTDILTKSGLAATKYICFVPGVGKVRIHRAWPFENWFSLTKKILNCKRDYKVVFLGGEDEKEIFQNSSFNNQVVNLIGKLCLSKVAKIISGASCLVSCDTGLLHIASALSKKVIGLYGPTLPQRTGPFTNDYQILSAKDCKCINKKKCSFINGGYCMNSLSIDKVLETISLLVLLLVFLPVEQLLAY
ncbi:MAG: glycosyltransferase family 9 protein [Candidatus Melainabacteria bacterium]|nr:glycosyltransferase family 9 protein [Candidatus Melainabacteria bacterium]